MFLFDLWLFQLNYFYQKQKNLNDVTHDSVFFPDWLMLITSTFIYQWKDKMALQCGGRCAEPRAISGPLPAARLRVASPTPPATRMSSLHRDCPFVREPLRKSPASVAQLHFRSTGLLPLCTVRQQHQLFCRWVEALLLTSAALIKND